MIFQLKRTFSLSLLLVIYSLQSYSQELTYDENISRYINTYKDIAISKMAEYGIPASITLAQGILESNAGRSDLAIKANNHFGIKCHKEWTGKRFYKDDDKPEECFRKYDDPVDSYRDHSLFLTTRERYKGLFSLPRDDYRGWAEGLKAAGYATNPKYAELLIRTIERYGLDRYDHPERILSLSKPDVRDSLNGSISPVAFSYFAPGPSGRKVFLNNHCMLVVARAGNDLPMVSKEFGIPLAQLLEYNDLKPGMKIRPGDPVYLQKKKNKGAIVKHTVQPDQTMWDIAQLYGIRLGKLLHRNPLLKDSEPVAGMILKLR